MREAIPEPDQYVWRHVNRENPDGSKTILVLCQGKDLRRGERWRFFMGTNEQAESMLRKDKRDE